MAYEVKMYNVGKEKTPDWLNEYFKRGVCKAIYDDDTLSGISISSPTGKLIAKVGDVILQAKSGLTVLKKEDAARYKKNKGADNNEE